MDRSYLVDKKIILESASGSKYPGEIAFQDDIGLFFIPDDIYYNSCFIPWHKVNRVHIKED